MAKRTRGVKGNDPVKRGSWGNGYLIEKKINKQRVSCSACINFREGGACKATSAYVPNLGYGYWKICNKFELRGDYASKETLEQVKRVKGIHYRINQSQDVSKTDDFNYEFLDDKFTNANSKGKNDEVKSKENEFIPNLDIVDLKWKINRNISVLCIEKEILLRDLIENVVDEVELYQKYSKSEGIFDPCESTTYGYIVFLSLIAEALECTITDIITLDDNQVEKILTQKIYDNEDLVELDDFTSTYSTEGAYFSTSDIRYIKDEYKDAYYMEKGKLLNPLEEPYFLKYTYDTGIKLKVVTEGDIQSFYIDHYSGPFASQYYPNSVIYFFKMTFD